MESLPLSCPVTSRTQNLLLFSASTLCIITHESNQQDTAMLVFKRTLRYLIIVPKHNTDTKEAAEPNYEMTD